jgi:hypothetical protein
MTAVSRLAAKIVRIERNPKDEAVFRISNTPSRDAAGSQRSEGGESYA